MQQVELGDRLILKRDVSQILAAGVVVQRAGKFRGNARTNGKARDWLRDYDGWDLPVYCIVDWQREPAPRAVSGLTQSIR